MRALAVAVFALAGCTKVSATYCDKHAEDVANCPAPDSGACTGDPDCAALDPSTPVCLDQTSCVQCAPDRTDACIGTSPVCGDDHRCHACVTDDECGSGVCLDGGACAAADDVSHVAEGGTGTSCTQDAPCGTLDAATAAGRPFIKVTGTIVDQQLATLGAGTVQLVGAPGARITRNTSGAILEVRGTASLAIRDLRFSGGLGDALTQNDATSSLALARVVIDENAGYGVNSHAGALTMTGCVVSGNNFGGVSAQDVTFTITNSIFVVNGDGSQSTVGGLRLSPLGASRFEFNTVADNFSTIGNEATRSLNCTAALTVRDNIFRTNYPGTTGVSPLCTAQFSLFDQVAPATGDNKVGDAMFARVDPLDPTHPTYYRLAPGSAAADSADPNAAMAIDIDGDARPANGRSDIGADERP